MKEKFPYTKAQFIEWLKKHKTTRFTQGHPKKCPIARALAAALKGKDVTFLAGSFWVKDKDTPVTPFSLGECRTAPCWASAVARKFDSYVNTPRRHTLTGAEVLKILGSGR